MEFAMGSMLSISPTTLFDYKDVLQGLCGSQEKPMYVHRAQKAAFVWSYGRTCADAASILEQLEHGSPTNTFSLSVLTAGTPDIRTHALFFDEYA